MATTWGNSRMYLPICKELEKKRKKINVPKSKWLIHALAN